MQVLLREVEDDVRLPRDTQDMNANEVVEHPTFRTEALILVNFYR